MVRAGGFADSAGILLGMNRVLCNFESGLCNYAQVVRTEQDSTADPILSLPMTSELSLIWHAHPEI